MFFTQPFQIYFTFLDLDFIKNMTVLFIDLKKTETENSYFSQKKSIIFLLEIVIQAVIYTLSKKRKTVILHVKMH